MSRTVTLSDELAWQVANYISTFEYPPEMAEVARRTIDDLRVPLSRGSLIVNQNGDKGTIVSVYGDFAWVSYGEGKPTTVNADTLTPDWAARNGGQS